MLPLPLGKELLSSTQRRSIPGEARQIKQEKELCPARFPMRSIVPAAQSPLPNRHSIYDLASVHRYRDIPRIVTEGKVRQEPAAGEKRSREGPDGEQDSLPVGGNR